MKIIEHGNKPNKPNVNTATAIVFSCDCGCKFEVEGKDTFRLKNADENVVCAMCPECHSIVSTSLPKLEKKTFELHEKVVFTPDNTVGVVMGRHIDDPTIFLVAFPEKDDPKCGRTIPLSADLLKPYDDDTDSCSDFENPYDALPDDYNLKELLSAVADEAAEMGDFLYGKFKETVTPENLEQLRTRVNESVEKGKDKIEKFVNSRPTFVRGDYVQKKSGSDYPKPKHGRVLKVYKTGICSVLFDGENHLTHLPATFIEPGENFNYKVELPVLAKFKVENDDSFGDFLLGVITDIEQDGNFCVRMPDSIFEDATFPIRMSVFLGDDENPIPGRLDAHPDDDTYTLQLFPNSKRSLWIGRSFALD